MSLVIYSIESKLKMLDQPWQSLTRLNPETKDEAVRLLETLRRAMPMKEFRIQEIHDEDIPF